MTAQSGRDSVSASSLGGTKPLESKRLASMVGLDGQTKGQHFTGVANKEDSMGKLK